MQSQMKSKFDELIAEKRLLQLKLKERQLKQEKEARERAMLIKMENQMSKQIQKQRGNSRGGGGGSVFGENNNSDSDREDAGALTKQEEKLLGENKGLMKRLENLEQKRGIKYKGKKNLDDSDEETKENNGKNSFLERMNSQQSLNNHLMRQGMSQQFNPYAAQQMGQINSMNPYVTGMPYMPGQYPVQSPLGIGQQFQYGQPMIPQTYMHPQLGMQQPPFMNQINGMNPYQQPNFNNMYGNQMMSPQNLYQQQLSAMVPPLNLNHLQMPQTQTLTQPTVTNTQQNLSLITPNFTRETKVTKQDSDRNYQSNQNTVQIDNEFETPYAIKQKLQNDEIIRQMKMMNGVQQFSNLEVMAKSGFRPQSSSRKINALDDGDM
eukprot:403351250